MKRFFTGVLAAALLFATALPATAGQALPALTMDETAYQNVTRCGGGVMGACVDGKWGMIDRDGTVLVPFQYDSCNYPNRDGELLFYMNKTAEELETEWLAYCKVKRANPVTENTPLSPLYIAWSSTYRTQHSYLYDATGQLTAQSDAGEYFASCAAGRLEVRSDYSYQTVPWAVDSLYQMTYTVTYRALAAGTDIVRENVLSSAAFAEGLAPVSNYDTAGYHLWVLNTAGEAVYEYKSDCCDLMPINYGTGENDYGTVQDGCLTLNRLTPAEENTRLSETFCLLKVKTGTLTSGKPYVPTDFTYVLMAEKNPDGACVYHEDDRMVRVKKTVDTQTGEEFEESSLITAGDETVLATYPLIAMNDDEKFFLVQRANGDWGYITRNGEAVAFYPDAGEYDDGVAVVLSKNGKAYLVDEQQHQISGDVSGVAGVMTLQEGVFVAACSDGYHLLRLDSTALGDVDGDGNITTTDARLTLQATADKVTLDEAAALAADVDGDGGVSTTDARLILQFTAEKITSFM